MPFEKGQSGNPGGRPKAIARVREAAREHTETALDILLGIARDGQSEAARVSAANSILDRAWGKPAQPLDGDGEGGPILNGIEVTFIRRSDAPG